MQQDKLSDDKRDEILRLVGAECARSIGFDDVNSGELTEQREKALLYARGEMPDLVMNLAGRSKVVSTDVADAIETVLPDLIDIFTGGDDVITFEPVAEGDIVSAQQETDYLYHLVFNKNNGWRVFYDAFKDALLCKTGVFSWRWDGEYEPPEEQHDGKSLMELARAMNEGEVSEVVQGEPDEMGQPTFSYTYRPRYAKGRVVIEAVPSEDLAVAPDTKSLATATYCVVRQRPRAQDLMACGYNPEAIEDLPAWSETGDSAEAQARDTVEESSATGETEHALRQVEIYRHYVRLYEKDEGRYCLYQVVTGGKGYTSNLIDIQEVSRIQLAAITPYINPHRFYGQSVADRLIEVQKIKTALMRMTLDDGNFALNQRMIVTDQGANEYTIEDLIYNEPGRPIRARTADAVVPVTSGRLNYDPLEHLEYFSTVGEQRTGVVRNAQGLNPDTLHDTKGGMEILANNAQKRTRMIARAFAETGVKDFLVNLHATVRENGASMTDTARLRGKEFVEIDPSTWRQRDDMVIQIGVGAGGREHDIIVGQQMAMIQEKLMMAQTMPPGPLISAENLYNSSMFILSRLGVKAPEQFIGNPKDYTPPPVEPQPDPQMVKVQADIQRDQMKLEMDGQKQQQDVALKQDAQVTDAQLAIQKLEIEAQIKREQIAMEAQLKREQMVAEFELKREQMAAEYTLKQQAQEREHAMQREQMDRNEGMARDKQDVDASLTMRKQDKDAEIASRTELGGDKV